MKKDVVVDMTSGKIAPQILKFAMPVLLGLIFQRVYNFADSWIVGHFLGDNSLAAVSVSGVGMYLMFSVVIGLTTGVGWGCLSIMEQEKKRRWWKHFFPPFTFRLV